MNEHNFFFNYSKTIIIIRPPLYHHIFKTDLIHPSLSQHACLLKAVTLIAVIVNFAKITIMSPLLFLQRVTFDCHKMTLLQQCVMVPVEFRSSEVTSNAWMQQYVDGMAAPPGHTKGMSGIKERALTFISSKLNFKLLLCS